MSRMGQFTAVFVLMTLVLHGTVSAMSSNERSRRNARQVYGDEGGLYPSDDGRVPYINGDLMDILKSPSKRQWCRKGMTYNPVLGSCTLTFQAMRGRGRSSWGH